MTTGQTSNLLFKEIKKSFLPQANTQIKPLVQLRFSPTIFYYLLLIFIFGNAVILFVLRKSLPPTLSNSYVFAFPMTKSPDTFIHRQIFSQNMRLNQTALIRFPCKTIFLNHITKDQALGPCTAPVRRMRLREQ